MALTRLGPNQAINLASNVTGTLATGNGGTGATSFTPGITMADHWYKNSSSTGNQNPITGWTRMANTGQGGINAGMTESSGTFTFPSTGVYLVKFNFNFSVTTNTERFAQFFIRGSTDGFSSSNTAICQATDGADNFSGNSDIDGGGNEMNTLYDVQNTSNNKIRFSVEFQGGSNTTLIGSSGGQGITTAMFIRLGDT